jgi:hypothetical protein
MAAELLICPNEEAAPMTVEAIRERFVSAGIACAVERHDDEPWIVFNGRESDLGFTVEPDGKATSAVLQAVSGDDPAFWEQVLEVFESFGWSYMEETF